MPTLNEVFTKLSMRRRYEVWFLRFGLADGTGAWWFRYLLMNPGRAGCLESPGGAPVQVWATWFPKNGNTRSFIQGFPLAGFDLSGKEQSPFHFRIGDNAIEEDSCRGSLQVDRHTITWNLRYHSTFRVTLSSKGWIGFSRSPHSDAIFSGDITLDGRRFSGNPLGFGVQGHNCGYRHRNFWTWTHAYFPRVDKPATTLEALTYEMPLGLVFRRAVLWHDNRVHIFSNLRETQKEQGSMLWNFHCERDRCNVDATIDGRGPSIHRLPYGKTNCSGTFEVTNNSLAAATVEVKGPDGLSEKLETTNGAVLEQVG